MLSRPDGQQEVWTRLHELLAINAEVNSVPAANHRLPEVLTIPRPGPPAPPRRRRTRAEAMADPNTMSVAEAIAAHRASARRRPPPGAAS